jgi:hypothetical protein
MLRHFHNIFSRFILALEPFPLLTNLLQLLLQTKMCINNTTKRLRPMKLSRTQRHA